MSEVKSIKALIKDIKGLRDRDIPYIAMLSLNNLAFDTKRSIEKEIGGKLNVKKMRLLSPVRIKKATKSNPMATVFIEEGTSWKTGWRYKSLKHHYFGGDRDRKGLEKSLIANGHMSNNEILTPPPGVSIKPWVYTKMIAQLRVTYKAGYVANESKKSRFRKRLRTRERYFIINSYTRSHLHPGIYVRMPDAADKGKPICILRIVKAPKYDKRLTKFEETVDKVHDRRHDMHLGDAMDYVLKKNKDMGWT